MGIFLLLLITFIVGVGAEGAEVFVDPSEKPAVQLYTPSSKERDALLDLALPERLKAESACADAELEDGKEFVDSIQVLKGRFSNSSKDQLLLGLKMSKCPQSGVSALEKVALIQDGQLLDVRETSGSSFFKVFESSTPGLNDVLVTGGVSTQGYSSTYGETLSFEGSKIHSSGLINKAVLSRDNCDAVTDNTKVGKEEVTVFFVRSRKPLKLSIKIYARPCGAGPNAFKYQSSKPLQFY